MAVQKRRWKAHKWILLLSSYEKGGEDLKSVLKKIHLDVDCGDSPDCYSGSRFRPVDSKVARLQSERSPNPKLRPFKLSELREMDGSVWYHLIACPQQTPIHLPFLINSRGVFIIVCHQADSSEDKLTYVRRTLDLIIDSTNEGEKSIAFIDGMDPKDFDRIPLEKYMQTQKFSDIDTLQEAEWGSGSHIAEIVIHRCNDLVFSEKVFQILKDKDDERKPLDVYRPSDDNWKDEVCIESLQSLHKLGWIYLQQQTALKWNLVFTNPKLFHDMLGSLYKLRNSGKNVRSMINSVCNQISVRKGCDYITGMKEEVVTSFEALLLNLNLAFPVNHETKLVSSYSKVNIDAIPVSIAPLLVQGTVVSQESFFKFANQLECKNLNKDTYLKISKVALNCITFQGHCFNLHMCCRVSTILEFRFEVPCSPGHQCEPKELTSWCDCVLKAIRKCAADSVKLGFTCDLAQNNVDHAKVCSDKFASYHNEQLFCQSGKGCCQPCMLDQKIWFGQCPQEPFTFDAAVYTDGSLLLQVPHVIKARKRSPADTPSSDSKRQPSDSGPTAPRAGMKDKITSAQDIIGVPVYKKGLIGKMAILGAALGIEEETQAILNRNGTIDAQLLEILNRYIAEESPTWRDFCKALKRNTLFKKVRKKIAADHRSSI